MTPLGRWLRAIALVTCWTGAMALVVVGCNDDTPPPDGGNGGDDADQRPVDADEVEDTGNYPPFDCVDETDELNMRPCMLNLPDSGPGTDWGTWCDGDCRPTCFPPTECPAPLVCCRHGVNYLCFPE